MSIATLFFLLGLAPHGNFPFTPPPARQTPPAVQTTQATNDSIAQLEKAAMRGDARAQSQLAERYACGDGVPRDEEAALKWWQSAADLGDQEAAQALARYQRDSAPSEQHLPANVLPNPKFTQALRDLTAAAIALQQQAEAGDAHAQYALAERYRKDEAVGANGKHADYWLRRAAAQGEANAVRLICRFADLPPLPFFSPSRSLFAAHCFYSIPFCCIKRSKRNQARFIDFLPLIVPLPNSYSSTIPIISPFLFSRFLRCIHYFHHFSFIHHFRRAKQEKPQPGSIFWPNCFPAFTLATFVVQRVKIHHRARFVDLSPSPHRIVKSKSALIF